MIARRGLEAVSLREINAEAGVANASAVQYHYGGRAGLIRAILAKHHPAVEARRHALLDQFDARQVLHVAFGTLLTGYGPQIRAVLAADEAGYRAGLERHFLRHLAPFVRAAL